MRLRYHGTMEVVPMINRPLYVDKIMAYTDTPFVKVLTGVRRCGKSTVLKMIMEKLQQSMAFRLSGLSVCVSIPWIMRI